MGIVLGRQFVAAWAFRSARGERENRWESVEAVGCEEVPSAVDHVCGDA